VLYKLYLSGRIKQDALGVLARTIVCIRQGCAASGPEAVFGSVVLQLAETIAGNIERRPAAARRARAKARRLSEFIGAGGGQERQRPEPAAGARPETAREGPAVQTQRAPQERAGEGAASPAGRQEQRPDAGAAARDGRGVLVSLLASEARVDESSAKSLLSTVLNYLAAYPSVGIIRFVEDVSRLARADARVVRTALEILCSRDIVEIREEGVVNLKRPVRPEGLLL
jgi:hypothetical protein